jgi:hypothetical protein
MAIAEGHKENFETLQRAFAECSVALMECHRKDGQVVVMLCTVSHFEDGDVGFTPFAEMVNGNPFAMYDPPEPNDDYP